MSTRIVVMPAPSRGGVVLRDPFTRLEIYIEREDLVAISARLLEEHDRLDVRRRHGA
jgi:hypothetical protein